MVMSEEAEPPLVGILGGMGPAATVDLYSKLIAATPATTDQEHLRVMIWADPTVPDRTAAIAGDGEDPTPKLVAGVQHLKDAGAEFYVAACNGAHAFLPQVREQVDLEYLSIVDVAAEHIEALPFASAAGLLATDATLTSGLYQEALRARGISPVLPAEGHQRVVMEAIYAVKAGNLTESLRERLAEVVDALAAEGADVVVGGCTEIPLALSLERASRPLIDPATLLANSVVERALRRGD